MMVETVTTAATAAIDEARRLIEERSEDLDALESADHVLRQARGQAIVREGELGHVERAGDDPEEIVDARRELEVVRARLEILERLGSDLRRLIDRARELSLIDTAVDQAPRLAERVASYRAVQAQLRQLESELRSASGQVQRGFQTAAREGRLEEMPVVDVEVQQDIARIIGAGDYRLPQPKGGPPPGSGPPTNDGAWKYDEQRREWRPIGTDPRGGRRQLSSGPTLPRRTR